VSLARLRTLLLREVRATFRDPFTIVIVVTVPLLALALFGLVLSTEVKGLALGFIDGSASPESRRLVADLEVKGTFVPRRFETRADLDRAIVAGEIGVAIVIPPDFDRRLRQAAAGATPPPEVQALYDGVEVILAGNAEGYLRGMLRASVADLAEQERRGTPAASVATRAPAGRAAGIGVAVVTRALFNPRLDGKPFMVAGTFGFVLTMLTTLITAVSVVNERQAGTFEQLQVTPATSLEILLGKILPLGAAFAVDVVLMMLLAGFVLGTWPAGSVVFFLALSTGYVLISLALGVMLSASSATPAAAVQKTVLLSIPLIQVSGFVYPNRNMPAVFRWLAEVFPVTHYIRASRAIYLRGEGPLALAPEIAALTFFGVLLVALAIRSMGART
jgi:ABC-2 type transport system permease protein